MNIFDRRSNDVKPERGRVLSDNMTVTIESEYPKVVIDLSELGLKSFSWEADDEKETWRPVTRLEPICRIKKKGYNLDLRWGKNAPDLMSLLTDLDVGYYSGLNLSNAVGDKDYPQTGKDNSYAKDIIMPKLGENLRTPISSREKVTNSEIKRNFTPINNRIPTYYITPRFIIRVKITHFNTEYEEYIFKNVALYSPTQATEENSSEIVESIKGFASWMEKSGTVKVDDNIVNLIEKMITRQLQAKPSEENLGRYDRKIINPDLKDLVNKKI